VGKRMGFPVRPELAPVSDAMLVEQMRQGDGGAFREIYDRHSGYVAGIVFRLCGGDGELDDIIQETFLAAARDARQIEHPERVRAWLTAVAVRRAKRHLTRRRSRSKLERDWSAERPASNDQPDAARRREVYAALDRLSPELRVPLVLSRVEGMTLPEVAEACGKSLNTVKRRIAAAEQRMRRLLGAE